MENIENGLRTYTTLAEMKRGTSFKFYEVEAREIEAGGKSEVMIRYGRIGTKGQTRHKGFSHSYAQAKRQALGLLSLKLDKGYERSSPLEALASAFDGPEERIVESSAPIVEPPVFSTGNPATDARLKKLTTDAHDKLRLTHDDRDKFWSAKGAYAKYNDECERIIYGVADSYARMRKTKAHRNFCTADVERRLNAWLKTLNETFRPYRNSYIRRRTFG